MAIVITVAQQKGGAGKTTLAANLAALLAGTRRVALLDIDPQHSLSRWHALREGAARAAPIALSDRAGWRLSAELDQLRQHHDIVVVDSPPQLDTDARMAVRAASLVLVPVQPSAPDLWAAEGTLEIARSEKRPARIVLNRVPAAASRLRDAISAEIARLGHTALTGVLGNRTAYTQAFAQGLGVTEAAPRSAASEELRSLVQEIEAVC